MEATIDALRARLATLRAKMDVLNETILMASSELPQGTVVEVFATIKDTE